jgi:hypothetical protein
MAGDGMELLRWRPADGCGWVEVEAEDSAYRPTRMEAEFRIDKLHVAVLAVGDETGVRISTVTQMTRDPEIDEIDPAASNSSEIWRRWDAHKGTLRPEDMTRFDPAAAGSLLESAAVARYRYDETSRPYEVAIGRGSPFLKVADIRRWLSGPEDTPRPGPKPKASPEQIAKLWRAAVKKKAPPARHIADTLEVSISTAHRYIAAARKAGNIDQEA